jgi:hypothetical protein
MRWDVRRRTHVFRREAMTMTMRRVFAVGLMSVCAVASLQAQTAKKVDASDPLFRAIAAQDAGIFDAYNKCELDKFGGYMAKDVEFYHDQTGLMVGRDAVVKATKENICGKVTRQLVAGSLEVYPLKNYGALEIGVHRFYHTGSTAPQGEGKFIHLWQQKDGVWTLMRVISYDHFSL